MASASCPDVNVTTSPFASPATSDTEVHAPAANAAAAAPPPAVATAATAAPPAAATAGSDSASESIPRQRLGKRNREGSQKPGGKRHKKGNLRRRINKVMLQLATAVPAAPQGLRSRRRSPL